MYPPSSNGWASDMTLQFAPFIPWFILLALAVLALILATAGFARGVRGTGIRLLASAAVLAALANPLLMQEDRCLLYTSPSPRDKRQSRMPSSA